MNYMETIDPSEHLHFIVPVGHWRGARNEPGWGTAMLVTFTHEEVSRALEGCDRARRGENGGSLYSEETDFGTQLFLRFRGSDEPFADVLEEMVYQGLPRPGAMEVAPETACLIWAERELHSEYGRGSWLQGLALPTSIRFEHPDEGSARCEAGPLSVSALERALIREVSHPEEAGEVWSAALMKESLGASFLRPADTVEEARSLWTKLVEGAPYEALALLEWQREFERDGEWKLEYMLTERALTSLLGHGDRTVRKRAIALSKDFECGMPSAEAAETLIRTGSE